MKPRTLPVADNRREWSTRARSAWVLLFLWNGSKLSNKEIAKLTGLTHRGTRYMMDDLASYFPIVSIDQRWQWMERD